MKHVKTQVIVNPESNHGRTRHRWREIKEALHSRLREFKYEFTEKPLQAIEISRQAVRSGHDLIIGVGGDGTMNEIANGFFEDRRLINPESTLGIVPSGTGCDLTKSLGIPPGLRDAVKVITDAPAAAMDVGRVSFLDNSGRDAERLFLNVSDFGVGGEVVKRVNEQRRQRKASSYVRCLVSAMANYRSRRIRIRVDGRDLPEDEYLVGAIANGRIFGKGMKIAPGARLDDGLFDLVLVRSMRFFEFCRHGWRIFLGTHLSHPKISLIRGREFEAAAVEEGQVLLELDGEQLGRLPARFEVLPHVLQVKGNIQA